MNLRDPKRIVKDMMGVRTGQYGIEHWSSEEVMADIQSLADAIAKDIDTIVYWRETLHKDNKKALKRVRSYTKALEPLSVKFRTLSV